MPRFACLEDVDGMPWELQYDLVMNTTSSLSEYMGDEEYLGGPAEICPEVDVPQIHNRNGATVIRIEGEEYEVFGEKRIDYYYDLYWEA